MNISLKLKDNKYELFKNDDYNQNQIKMLTTMLLSNEENIKGSSTK